MYLCIQASSDDIQIQYKLFHIQIFAPLQQCCKVRMKEIPISIVVEVYMYLMLEKYQIRATMLMGISFIPT